MQTAISFSKLTRDVLSDVVPDLADGPLTLPDGGQVRLHNSNYVFEIDTLGHWAEAVGQVLYLSNATGRIPVIVIGVGEHAEAFERQQLSKLELAAANAGIVLWKLNIRTGELMQGDSQLRGPFLSTVVNRPRAEEHPC